ncbi:glycosyltransferase [Streptomyces sp. NPDC000070]|uniref:glycosyltransferase n=1 Tax=Streptomyces sp. NPDC000070 TaxID=3154240 RepID=UPI00332E72A9
MRALFVAAPERDAVLPMVPAAQAVRRAGHEVFVAGVAGVMPALTSAGLTGIPVSMKTLEDCRTDRRGENVAVPPHGHEHQLALGRMHGRLAADCLPGLATLARQWTPDVVVAAAHAYAAPLVAHDLGVPWVRFATDLAEPLVTDLAAIAELGPELEQAGLYEMPLPMLTISVSPPSLRPADARPALLARPLPYDTQVTAEPWMYTAERGPRVLVSLATDVLADALPGLAELDAEVVVALQDGDTGELPPLPEHVRAARVPLDVVAPTCAAVVHDGARQTVLTCLATGVPQVCVPRDPAMAYHCEQLAAAGVGAVVSPSPTLGEEAARACRQVLAEPSFRAAAERVREEIHGMERLPVIAAELERVAASVPTSARS